MAVELKWRPDPQAEDLMAQLGLEWEKCTVILDGIDWIESELNGARITTGPGTPGFAETCERYRMAMQAGATFPEPVLYRNGKNPLPWILSGNRRLSAARELHPHQRIPAYVITTKDKLAVDTFLRVANIVHGDPVSHQERIRLAMYCVKVNGLSSADAAKLFLVKPDTILGYLRADDTRNRLEKENVNQVELLNQTHLLALSRIKDTSAQVKLASLATSHLPTGERLTQVAATLDTAPTQSERTKVLREFEIELRKDVEKKGEEQQVIIRRPRRDTLVSTLTRLANFLDKGPDGTGFTDLEQLQCERDKDASHVKQLWRRVSVRMNTITG